MLRSAGCVQPEIPRNVGSRTMFGYSYGARTTNTEGDLACRQPEYGGYEFYQSASSSGMP